MPRIRHPWVAILSMLGSLLLPGPAPALEPDRRATQYVARVWSVADGLPDQAIRTLIQSRDGYLWLGTHGGLARFDGRRFVIFDHATSGLGHDHVSALAEDSRGRIWIGTEQGLFRLEHGAIKPIEALGTARILALASDPDGRMWVGGERGLLRVDADDSVERFGKDEGLGLVQAIEFAGSEMYVGTNRGAYRRGDGGFMPIAGAGSDQVGALLAARDGRLWVVTPDALLTLEQDQVSNRIAVRWEYQQIRDLLEDRHGNIWAASYGAGIQRIETRGFDTVGIGTGYGDRRPNRLLEDREGNLWAATREGLIRLRDGAAIAWSTEEGLAAAHSRGVFEDRDGSIWVAHVAGVSRIGDGVVRNFDRGDGLPAEVQRTILRDRDNVLWVGGEGGLARFDGTRFSALSRADGLPSDNVKIAINSRDGHIWTGHTGGVGVVRGGRAHSPPEFAPLASANVEAMYETRDGTLYVGTLDHGLWRWRLGQIEQVELNRDRDRIGVRAIHEDEAGRLWIGTTARGLYVLDGNRRHHISREQGFPIYGVWSITDDGNDHWWFSADTGIWRFAAGDLLDLVEGRLDRVSPTLRLTERDGMKSRESNGGGSPAAVLASDGRLWVATAGGAVSVKLDASGDSSPIIAARVETVRAGDRAIEPAVAGMPRATHDRAVAFDYTAIHLADPDAIRFRYRLLGQDENWTDAGDRRSAYYTNLSPGDYEFEIEARLADRVNWTRGEGVSLSVAPFWHERATVRAGLVAMLFAVFAWLLQRRFTTQRRIAARLQQEIESRTAELRAANEELGRIAAIDSLTGLSTPRVMREHLARTVGPGAAATPVSLLLIDVDDFKLYNDTYGHLAGDTCLKRVAAALGQCAEAEGGLAARYGGEEFALVVTGIDLGRAEVIAETLRAGIEALEIPSGIGARHGLVTVSVGIGHSLAYLTTDQALIEHADTALYGAKRAGRNRVETLVIRSD
jgi:diguanylate cyclase (GGDEF)-like protein